MVNFWHSQMTVSLKLLFGKNHFKLSAFHRTKLGWQYLQKNDIYHEKMFLFFIFYATKALEINYLALKLKKIQNLIFIMFLLNF